MNMNDHICELKNAGFTKLTGVISESRAKTILERIDAYRAAALQEAAVMSAVKDRRRQRVGRLLHRDEVFRELLLNDSVLSICKQVMRHGFICSSWSSHTLLPGFDLIAWHRDYPHWDDFSVGGPVLSIQVFWMLDEFTSENGATRFIATSHRKQIIPETTIDFEDAQAILGEPGDVIVADARTFHTPMPNQSQNPRTCLLASYVRPFVFPMENIGAQIAEASHGCPELDQLYGGAIREPIDIRF